MSNRPLPTAVRELRGNPGKRARNKHEPKPPKGVPECPDFLSDAAKRAWWRIAPKLNEMGVLTLADEVAVELLCDCYVEYRTARGVIDAKGAVYEMTSERGSMLRARPEVGIAQDAFKRLKGMLVEYGLTAASRAKLKTSAGDESDPLDEFFD